MFKRVSHKSEDNIFNHAPFLTPWYFTKDKPVLAKDGQPLKWRFIQSINDGYAGIMALEDSFGNLLGFLKTYNYIHVDSESNRFLIWNRDTKLETANPCVNIHLYDSAQLTALNKSDLALLDFHKSKSVFHFSCKPLSTIKYFIEPDLEENTFSFPAEFKIFESFLVIAEYEGLYDKSEGFGNSLILELVPQRDTIYCFKQDWFNKGNLDIGYQWITRAIRSSDGLIRGQGIRIADFILDETGTALKS
jgi:hypothetical protein